MTGQRKAAALAMIGFSLGNLTSNQAQAFWSADGTFTTFITTGVTTTVASAGLVAIIVVAIVKKDAGAEMVDGEQTKRLIDAALISSRGDLGMELALLVESPSAYAKFENDISRGEGSSLDAMMTATLLSKTEIVSAWQQATHSLGQTRSSADATDHITQFSVTIGPRLTPTNTTQSDLVWGLIREREQDSFPEGAVNHHWLASWLDVPVDEVATATWDIVNAQDPQHALRQEVLDQPESFINELAILIERDNRQSIEARIASLVNSIEAA